MVPLSALVGMVVVGIGLSLVSVNATGILARAQDDRPTSGSAVKVDRFGDPLPDGAVARLGTLGFRAPNLIGIGFRKTGDLVAFGEDLALHVWPADGRPKATTTLLTGKKQYGWRRALSADARYAAAFMGSKLVVWDVSGDKPAEYLSRHINDVYRLAFSANGDWLAVNDSARGQQENLLLCNLRTKEWSPFVLGGSFCESLSFTADGKRLAVATDRDVAVIDTAQKQELRRVSIPKVRPFFAALSPDGKTLAVLPIKWMHGPDQVVRLFSLETGQELKAFTLSFCSARWVGFSPDGTSVWAGGPHGLIEWDTAAEKIVREVAGPATHSLAFCPDGRRLASHSESAVLLWDIKQGQIIRRDILEGGHTAAIMGMTLSPDGAVIATNALDGEIRLWEVGTWRPLGRVRSSWGRDPRIAFTRDSQSFIAVADDYVTPILFDAATGKELRRFAVPEDLAKREMTSELRLSEDGQMLKTVSMPVVAGQKIYIVQWDVPTGKMIDRTETTRSELEMYSFTSYSLDGQWEVESGAIRRVGEKALIRVVPANETGMLRAKFTSDSRLVSLPRAPQPSSAEDRSRGGLVIYDLIARATLGELPTGRPLRHAFAPGNRQVAVFSPEEISLWDLPSGKKLWGVPNEHGSAIRDGAIAFTAAGRQLITGHDCTALVWDMVNASRTGDTRPAKLSADELARLWDTLASADAIKAYRAEWELAEHPAEAVALLRDRLKPVQAAETGVIRQLLAKLDAPDFAEREAASKRLRTIGDAAVPELHQALKGELSAEQKRRVEEVLDAIAAPAFLSGDALGQMRAISVLERTATPEALQALAELAAGIPEARLTRKAEAAAARLKQVPRIR